MEGIKIRPTIKQIRTGLEGLAREYKKADGDLKRAEINSAAFTYLQGNCEDNIIRLCLFRYYEKQKFNYGEDSK